MDRFEQTRAVASRHQTAVRSVTNTFFSGAAAHRDRRQAHRHRFEQAAGNATREDFDARAGQLHKQHGARQAFSPLAFAERADQPDAVVQAVQVDLRLGPPKVPQWPSHFTAHVNALRGQAPAGVDQRGEVPIGAGLAASKHERHAARLAAQLRCVAPIVHAWVDALHGCFRCECPGGLHAGVGRCQGELGRAQRTLQRCTLGHADGMARYRHRKPHPGEPAYCLGHRRGRRVNRVQVNDAVAPQCCRQVHRLRKIGQPGTPEKNRVPEAANVADRGPRKTARMGRDPMPGVQRFASHLSNPAATCTRRDLPFGCGCDGVGPNRHAQPPQAGDGLIHPGVRRAGRGAH